MGGLAIAIEGRVCTTSRFNSLHTAPIEAACVLRVQMGSCRCAGAVALALVLVLTAAAAAAANVNLAPGTYGLHTLGRLNCGSFHGFWSVKPCGGLNIVDEWKVDDGSGRQQWKLVPHSSGKGVTIQVRVHVRMCSCVCIHKIHTR